jgi:hypothetical protein
MSPQKERHDMFQLDGATSSPQRGESKLARSRSMQFSLCQVVALTALSAFISAMLTAMISAHSFSLTMTGQFMEQQPFFVSRQLRPSSTSGTTRETTGEDSTAPIADLETQTQWDDNPTPKIVWLMSFPNRYVHLSLQDDGCTFVSYCSLAHSIYRFSGTSFTIHMTREATNCTTATNYGLEGEIKDAPSEPAIQDITGQKGPWLELIPGRTTRVASTILTKTHCKGFCSGSYCGPEKTFHTVRSFMMGCLTGNQGIRGDNGHLKLIDQTYSKNLVYKSIHIFRHPLDNVVARFHLEFNEKRDAGDTTYMNLFPKNSTGFHRWCEKDDHNRGLVRSRFMDRTLRELMLNIPCFVSLLLLLFCGFTHRSFLLRWSKRQQNEFYRYVQWHNLAFATTQAMNVTTMILHYHEYSQDFPKARHKVLNFLELPRVGEGIEFHDGKVYRNYYTNEQKHNIRAFLEEFATAETWQELKDYDFETNLSPDMASMDIV